MFNTYQYYFSFLKYKFMKSFIIAISTMMCAFNLSAQNVVDCAFTSIDADISQNTTLYANILYKVKGCVHVLPSNTLEIQAGAIVMFEEDSKASLIIERGAY